MQISQTWFPGTHCTYLKKLTLVCEGFVQICQKFTETEILTKLCSFSQKMGSLPFILTVSKN